MHVGFLLRRFKTVAGPVVRPVTISDLEHRAGKLVLARFHEADSIGLQFGDINSDGSLGLVQGTG
jgi:hypothetical protein